MEIPRGFQVDEGKSEDYRLKIHRNIWTKPGGTSVEPVSSV